MEISCGFPPSNDAVDHAVLAESLGYKRAWVYDSPALYGDVWVTLARMADRTERIGLGPAVLIPNLRHVLVQASAIATLESLAPDRTVAAIGTGFTGRQALGQKALPWREVEEYIRTLQALLRGETVEVEGAMIGMIPAGGTLPQPPIHVPILVAANGPKGLAVAEELGDGVMTVIGAVPGGFEWCSVLAFGTVLEEGESPSSERALAAAGPGVTVVYHAMYGGDPTSVDALPGGAEWRSEIEKVPEEIRHLTVHAEHMVRVSEHDRRLLATAGDLMSSFTYTGTAKEVRARIDALEASGVTELLYAPMGPDVPRELRAFAAMAGL